jgi:hypothetical protein
MDYRWIIDGLSMEYLRRKNGKTTELPAMEFTS